MKQLYSYKTTLILVLILIILPIQLTVAETISSTRAIEDADYLWEKLEAVHPKLYFETPKEETEDEFKGWLYNKSRIPMDLFVRQI
ncbi:hypothetical protein KGY79_08690 [Candidatus Bipolaricaulota bacterium]|nr:hypothetical protein [Candidatus Bipolaricaulota bacterium]